MSGKEGQQRAVIRRRSRARRLAVQALYQHQLTGQPLEEIRRQFEGTDGYSAADAGYFAALTGWAERDRDDLDALIARFADRPIEQIDPVEHAILWTGLAELKGSSDLSYRIVINEAVELARRFGADDGHKYVNAIMDKARRELRKGEP